MYTFDIGSFFIGGLFAIFLSFSFDLCDYFSDIREKEFEKKCDESDMKLARYIIDALKK